MNALDPFDAAKKRPEMFETRWKLNWFYNGWTWCVLIVAALLLTIAVRPAPATVPALIPVFNHTFSVDFHGAAYVRMGESPDALNDEEWDTNVYSPNLVGYDFRATGTGYFDSSNGVTFERGVEMAAPGDLNPLADTFSMEALHYLNTVKGRVSADQLTPP